MAGESPGKSEQRKSSGETTASERDPRLAVFRDAEADDTPSDGTDTDAVIPPPAEEDARLREAVATWVSAPTPAPSSAEPERAEPTSREPDSGPTPEAERAAEPDSAGEDPDATPDDEAPAGEDATDEPTSGGAASGRDAGGDWAASDKAAADGDDSGDAAVDDAAPDDKADAGDADREEEAPAEAASGGDTPGDSDAASDEAASDDAADDEAPAGAPAGDADDDEVASDKAGAEEAGAEPEAGDGGDAARAGRDGKSPDTLVVGNVVGNKAARSALEAPERASGRAAGSKGGEDGEGRQEGPDGPEEGDRPVDQPTAVFKALKRPGAEPPAAEPPVDQPTTALKLPDRGGSTFVPLKRDDQPSGTAGTASTAGTSGTAGTAVRPGAVPSTPLPAPGAFAGAEQTRQQPLPPKPPLDLLAELTNTPPPPQTPARTAFRRVKIWTPLVVLLLIVFAVVQAVRPLPAPTLDLTAKPTFSFGGKNPTLPWPGEGQGYMVANGLGTMDSFGEQKAVPIGSVAKAMTAYLVLKDHPLKPKQNGPSVPVDAKAESDGQLFTEDESTLDTVKAGDKLSLRDALSALMIPSANNIARLLARWDAGSEKAFVKKMNDTAKELGMKNTTYTDPSGLIATTVSTSEDQVKLGQRLVEIPALMNITKLPSWTDPSGKTWRNYNTLVPYNGALGIKTGTTTKAGGCLLFAAHKMVGGTDQLIVGAVLGQHKAPIIDTVNAVSKTAMMGAQDELESKKIVRKGQVVGNVDDGMGGSVPVVATKDVDAVGWSGLTVKLDLDATGTLPHAAAAGTHVGTLSVGEGASQVKVAVALKSDLVEPGFGSKLTRVS
ncbi:hypothetical protein HY68_13795 [Streptomyces sp. AcH 505]|nr:hypothetical protein HY68_13795 [Streptomyces sp. AcH 505]